MEQPTEAPVPRYDRDELLGRGTFASVYGLSSHTVVKKILKDGMDKVLHVREEEAMRRMDHPNVLKLIGVAEDNDFKYLVLERCMGTVKDYITGDKKFDEMPPEVEALRQMANGLAYIHSQEVVHRDIKPANVLISSGFVLKIADFGCCKPTAPDGSMSVTSGPKGTKTYFAPEYLRLEVENVTAEERKNIRADKSIDIFSLGCLFFTYIVNKGIHIHLFATPGRTFKLSESYESKVANNILSDKKFMEENGMPRGHYAFEMIDGMTQALSKNRWPLEDGEPGINSVLGTINTELQRQQSQ
ncbi:serine/threonine-protein kinase/endoribonuclease IRE2-like [Daphnia carinata]|uniref:serine/threonine-protein kinase/endoribonuclease IRE2-like n=1 Tax=Daphnia carinata TaxID=120202 RepID=UPI00257CE646|nr:serine/threonine-protein kinase/endoribonuclease IRE2-like [Daphnia carinata]